MCVLNMMTVLNQETLAAWNNCAVISGPVWALGSNAPCFTCGFWRYINCLFVYFLKLPSLFSSFFTFFLTRLHRVLSTLFRIGPFHFQAGGGRRRPIVALVFFVLILHYFVMEACLLLLCFI